jgi:hypothetical protein
MKKLMTAGLLMLACLGLNMTAQDWYHDRLARFQGEDWRKNMFQHVKTDLEYVQHNAPAAAPRERKRLERTKQELTDLQGKLESNRFDQGEVNDVIDSLVKSANDTRLSPQDKEVLNDDVKRMRDYREHHDHWGH